MWDTGLARVYDDEGLLDATLPLRAAQQLVIME